MKRSSKVQLKGILIGLLIEALVGAVVWQFVGLNYRVGQIENFLNAVTQRAR